MHVGVTGASGLIGRTLVTALQQRGDSTVRFVRTTSDHAEPGVIRFDPTSHLVNEQDLERAGSFDAVVNLAGAGIGDRRWSVARRREIRSSRLDVTGLLATTFARTASTGVLVSASAIGWYGSRGHVLLDESSSRGDGFLSDVCQAWEEATSPLEGSAWRVAHLRTGVVLTHAGGALAKQLPLYRLGLGGRLGAGQQWMSVISLLDAVNAVLWIIDHQLSGPVNIVAPEAVTNRTFTSALAHAVHRPALLHAPAPLLELVLGKEMARELLLTSQRVAPTRLLESGFTFAHPTVSTALHWALTHPGT